MTSIFDDWWLRSKIVGDLWEKGNFSYLAKMVILANSKTMLVKGWFRGVGGIFPLFLGLSWFNFLLISIPPVYRYTDIQIYSHYCTFKTILNLNYASIQIYNYGSLILWFLVIQILYKYSDIQLLFSLQNYYKFGLYKYTDIQLWLSHFKIFKLI